MSNLTSISINGPDDDLKSAQDIFFDDATLPADTTAVVSDELQVNDGTSGVEIVIDYPAITAGTSRTIDFILYHSDVKGTGVAGTAETILSLDASSTAVDAGKFRYVPNKDIGLYGVISEVAGIDLSALSASVYMNTIPNRK